MRVNSTVHETYACDACDARAETAGGYPRGWAEYYAWLDGGGAGVPASLNNAVLVVHVCPRCLDRGPGLLGRRVHEFLTIARALPEEEATHGS